MLAKRLLFVCTGNTCRSVIAHALMHKQSEQGSAETPVKIESAGVFALEGSEPTDYVIELLQEKGINFCDRRSRMLSQSLVEDSDLILVMTAAHKEEVSVRFPEAAEKIYMLSEFASGKQEDIEDPFGGSKSDYIRVAEQVERYLIDLWIKL